MSLEIAEKLVNEIVEKRKQYLQNKIQRYPASNFRASDIPDCNRYMVYSVLDWQKKELHDEGLQAIFERGNIEERQVVQDLMAIGFNFVSQQTPIEIKNRQGEVICRGSIDGKIIYNKEAIPCEIKSMNMNTFNSLNSLDDFTKRPLHRKYLRQMQLYLFGNNEEAGIFILTNLQGHYKFIVVTLSMEECEWILQRLERNWEFVKKKEYPDPMGYNEKICGWCGFKHLCLPEIKNEGSQMIDNPALEEKLERREDLKILVEEYDEIDSSIKDLFRNVPQAFIGKTWQIISQKRTGTRIDTKALPEEIKKQYSVPTETVTVKILKL